MIFAIQLILFCIQDPERARGDALEDDEEEELQAQVGIVCVHLSPFFYLFAQGAVGGRAASSARDEEEVEVVEVVEVEEEQLQAQVGIYGVSFSYFQHLFAQGAVGGRARRARGLVGEPGVDVGANQRRQKVITCTFTV